MFGHFLDRAESAEMIGRAGDLGINLIDTADVYSGGLSESFVGDAVHANRSRWVLASKVGVESTGTADGTGHRETIRSRVEGSLRRLRTDCIDIYQLHHRDPVTPVEETVAALAELVREGKIRAYGLSNFAAPRIRELVKTARLKNLDRPVTVQSHLNVLKRDACDSILPLCKNEGIGVLAYGALARGVLSGKYREDTSAPARSRAKESASVRADLVPVVFKAVASLEDCARRFGLSISRMCVAWALAQPGVASVLAGVRDNAQLEDAVRAAEVALSFEQLQEIEQSVGPAARFRGVGLGEQIMR